MTATQTTEAAIWDIILPIARYIDAHPFITERELAAAGFSKEDVARTVSRAAVTCTRRPYGNSFYTVRK